MHPLLLAGPELAGAAAVVAVVLLAWRLKRRGGRGTEVKILASAGAAAGSGEAEASAPETPACARVRAFLQEHGCEFEDLKEFGLVRSLDVYCGEVRAAQGEAGTAATADRVMLLALADAILKLEEPGVPREIAGQRLAEVFTTCQEAVEWPALPAAAACARRFLDREEGLAASLAAELQRPHPGPG